jgi:L-asparagine transporter-like permease
VAYGLASPGLAFKAWMKVDARGTPRNALYFISAWIGLLAVTSGFEFLIRFMMMVAITVDTMVLIGYFRLRIKRPDLKRPFKVPGYPWIPGITVVLYIAILAILVGTQPRLTVGAGGMLLLLVIAGWFTARRNASLGEAA